MNFVMFGCFQKYGGWPMTVIDVCKRFYEKYKFYPNYIRMKEKTMDALFEENEKAYDNPEAEEHIVTDSAGNILIPVCREDDVSKEEFIESLFDDEGDFGIIMDDEFEEDDCIYPMYFGGNDDCTVSFITNKFELMFLEGDDLPDDYFIVQFGEGPTDGGEDFDVETENIVLELRKVA